MKKLLIWNVMFLIALGFSSSVIAGDKDDLKKLQPLTAAEKALYKKVKKNKIELHKFIGTRTYFRAVDRILGVDWRKKEKLSDKELDVIPIFSDDKKTFNENYFIGLVETELYVDKLMRYGAQNAPKVLREMTK